MNRVTIKSDMLRWACARSGKNPDDLSGRFPKLRRWMSEDEEPTLKQLERFAKATYTPVGFFSP